MRVQVQGGSEWGRNRELMKLTLEGSQLEQKANCSRQRSHKKRDRERGGTVAVIPFTVAVEDFEAIGSCTLDALHGSRDDGTLTNGSNLVIVVVIDWKDKKRTVCDEMAGK